MNPVVNHAVGDEVALTNDVQQRTGVVLISWEHRAIVDRILLALTKGQKLLNLPSKWDKTRFDVVLRFDREPPGGEWKFRQLYPQLLAGDRELPVCKAIEE